MHSGQEKPTPSESSGSVHSLAQTPREQLEYFDDTHKRAAKPRELTIPSPEETDQRKSAD